MIDTERSTFKLSEVLEAIESHALYQVLPVVGHRRALNLIRSAFKARAIGGQRIERLGVSLTHLVSVAHRCDHERARVTLDELEMIFVEIDRARVTSMREEAQPVGDDSSR